MLTAVHAQEKRVEVPYTKLKAFDLSLEACRKAGFVFTEKKQEGSTLLISQAQGDTLYFEKLGRVSKLIYASLAGRSPASLPIKPGDGDGLWSSYFGVKVQQVSRWYFTDDTGCIEVQILRKQKRVQRIVVEVNSCD